MNDQRASQITAASSHRSRSRVRTQWLVLSGALIVLAGLLVAWSLSQAADRVQVVQVRAEVRQGELINADDLSVVGVSSDSPLTGLVPATSLNALVGRVAAIDMKSGSLLLAGMWADAPELSTGENSVGAVLKVGAFPSGLARGDVALAVGLDLIGNSATGDAGATPADAVQVRVLDVTATDSDALVVTLAVPSTHSVAIARLAVTDRLVLVGLPVLEPSE